MTKSPFFGGSRPAAVRQTSTTSTARYRADSESSESTAVETPEEKLANHSKTLSSPLSSPPPPLRNFDFSQQHVRPSTLPSTPTAATRRGSRNLRIPRKLVNRIPKKLVHQDDSWISRTAASPAIPDKCTSRQLNTPANTQQEKHQATQSVSSYSEVSDSSEREKLTPLPLRVRKLPDRSAFEPQPVPSHDPKSSGARAVYTAGLAQQQPISLTSILQKVDKCKAGSFEEFAEKFQSGRKNNNSGTNSEPDSLHTPEREKRHRKLTLETLTDSPVSHEEYTKHFSPRDPESPRPSTLESAGLESANPDLTTANTTGTVLRKSRMASLRPESALALTAHRREAIKLAKTQQSVVAEKCKRSNQEAPGYTFDELIGKGSFGRVYKG